MLETTEMWCSTRPQYPLYRVTTERYILTLFLAAGDWRPPRHSFLPTLDFRAMFAFLLTLLIIDALLLSVVVLLQAGQGGGLASLGGGGTDTVLGGRQAVTILTKLSWWCGGIFLLLSLVLSFVPRGGNSGALQERLRAATPAEPTQPAPLPLGTPTQPPAQTPGAPPAAAPAQPAPSAEAPAPKPKQ
jgi:preprotein translocase subunit SecG